MPSFIIHTITGKEIIKRLNLSENDQKKFLIGNILPDSTNLDIPKGIDEWERKRIVQNEKKSTHFRTKESILEYPDMEFFLSKYKPTVQNNIITLGYAFHLFTDYYYFKNFLPKQVKFLDENENEITEKIFEHFVLVNKTKKVLPRISFWSKSNIDGLYQEYTRANKYLMNKYNLSIDTQELIDFLNTQELKAELDEINDINCYQVVYKLDKLLKETDLIEDYNLRIFNETELQDFINETITSFLDNYSDLLDSYK